MDAVTKVAEAIKNAEGGKRVATIHYQALKNAKILEGIDLHQFCREVGVKVSYSAEITKMISLRKFMNEMGVQVVFP